MREPESSIDDTATLKRTRAEPLTFALEVELAHTPRVALVKGQFDLSIEKAIRREWTMVDDLPERWNVGAIIGPSGEGKSAVARRLFGDAVLQKKDENGHDVPVFRWSPTHAVVDGLPGGRDPNALKSSELSHERIIGLLSGVGFNTPIEFLKPFHTLSNGQQFRATMARAIAETIVSKSLCVFDEFCSLVDEQTGRSVSVAIAKLIRDLDLRFIAVTCHGYVLQWLCPDWWIEMPGCTLNVAQRARGSLPRSRRPPIELEVVRVTRQAWERFRSYHYLSGNLHQSAQCFMGLVDGSPCTFTAVLPHPNNRRPGWREHRTVCLPSFQGMGVGNAMSEFIASCFIAKPDPRHPGLTLPYFSSTSHPAMIRHRLRRTDLWRLARSPGFKDAHRGYASGPRPASASRETWGFEFVGPARPGEARRLGICA